MDARIYKPEKSAMQSGKANSRKWVLEYISQDRGDIDPLMGWTSSTDTRKQLRLRFDTQEEALAYAEREGLQVQVMPARQRKIRRQSYADNFK